MNWLFDKNILIHFHGIQEKHPFLKYFLPYKYIDVFALKIT
jgi:hypothetical protein